MALKKHKLISFKLSIPFIIFLIFPLNLSKSSSVVDSSLSLLKINKQYFINFEVNKFFFKYASLKIEFNICSDLFSL